MDVTKKIATIYNRVYNRVSSDVNEKRDKKVSRHIVVIESDDWGAIRVPSRKVYDALMTEGYAMDKRPYERYDCLEADEDVKSLSEVLLKYRDKNGNHPIFTLNYLSANPDFQRIKEIDYKEYLYEDILCTYRRYSHSNNVFQLVNEGIKAGVFMPQCHGREHFNVCEWLKALQTWDVDVLTAFKYGMCGIFPKAKPSKGNQYMVALRSHDSKSQQYVCNAVAQSLIMFREIWGFESRSFIAPCYTWNDKIEDTLYSHGVKLVQGTRIRRSSDNISKKYVYAGKKSHRLVYSIRNCFFEPATTENYSTDDLLTEIERAFKKKHIAVISSHRINYVGGIDVNNRIKTLRLLDELLSKLITKYPDVEFMSSDQLIDILK